LHSDGAPSSDPIPSRRGIVVADYTAVSSSRDSNVSRSDIGLDSQSDILSM